LFSYSTCVYCSEKFIPIIKVRNYPENKGIDSQLTIFWHESLLRKASEVKAETEEPEVAKASEGDELDESLRHGSPDPCQQDE